MTPLHYDADHCVMTKFSAPDCGQVEAHPAAPGRKGSEPVQSPAATDAFDKPEGACRTIA